MTGGTISWASDGWHEVQYASSCNTVSEGGQSATLDPGTYNVINHTTGERFEGVVVGYSPTTAERLLGSNASSSNFTRSSNSNIQVNVESEVTVTEETRPDNDDLEDFRSDERNTVGVGIAVGVIGVGIGLASGPVGATVILGDGLYIGSDIALNRMNATETVKTTTVVNADGSVTRTQTGNTKNQDNDPISSTTTRTTSYDDGRETVSRFDSTTGVERTTDTNQNGVTTVTVSRPDNASANAPRTNTTYDENGVETTTVTSPTGTTYGPAGTNGVEVEPEVSTTPVSRPSRPEQTNSSSDYDNSGGGMSSSESAEAGGYGTSEGGEFG